MAAPFLTRQACLKQLSPQVRLVSGAHLALTQIKHNTHAYAHARPCLNVLGPSTDARRPAFRAGRGRASQRRAALGGIWRRAAAHAQGGIGLDRQRR